MPITLHVHVKDFKLIIFLLKSYHGLEIGHIISVGFGSAFCCYEVWIIFLILSLKVLNPFCLFKKHCS